MFELLSTIVSGVLGGGATGLLGVLLQRFFDWRKQSQDLELLKLNNELAIQLRSLELEAAAKAATLDASVRQQMAEFDMQARAEAASADAYAASMQADRATYLDAAAQKMSRLARWAMTIVDFSRGIVRPWGTIYLMGVTTAMFWWTTQLAHEMGVKLTAEQVLDLQLKVIQTILYLVTTSWVWWFGVRPQAKK